MLYEIYQNKILKAARVLSKIVRILPYVITCIAIISTIVITVLALRGTVLKTECPSKIEYGQAVTCEAKAFWSDVYYEYSADGGNSWSMEMPRLTGDYRVRAVGRTIFDNPRHGKALDFTIVPKRVSISVVEEFVMYGDSPSAQATLEYSDVLECDGFIFENGKADTSGNKNVAKVYDVKADTEHIRILDSEGNDVTKEYVLEPAVSQIAITKRPIKVTVDNATHVYDALPFSFNVYELTGGSLIDGDVLLATFTAELTDVGTIANEPVFKIATNQGADRTVFYDIASEFGTLTVEKRPLVVTSESDEAEYIGKDYEFPDFAVDESTPMAKGHTLTVTSELKFRDVGEYLNSQLYAVLDESGADKTGNYSIFLQEGKITITHKHVLLTTESAEWEYDGQDHEHYDFPQELFLENHTCDYETVSIRNVGEIENAFIIKAVYDEQGRDVTHNYSIDGEYGTLRVTPRPLSIVSGSESWVYDGTDHVNKDVVFDGLLETHECFWSTDSIRNVGEKENLVHVSSIQAEDGENVIANYEITYTSGMLSVTPRALQVYTADGSWIYDGTQHSLFDCKMIGLVKGHYAESTDLPQIKNVGKIENVHTIKVYSDNEPANGVINGQRKTDVTSNYEITYVYGTLEVVARPVTIRSLDCEWIYDAEVHGYPEYIIDSPMSLVEGEELVVWNWATATDAGKVQNSFDYLIHDAQCRHDAAEADDILEEYACCDTTSNYDVTCIFGTLTVYPRPIRIKPVDAEKVYDDTPLVATEIELMEDSPYDLVEGHVIEAVTMWGSIVDVGTAKSGVETYRILDASSRDVTANYYAEVRGTGTLTITPRPITVYTESAEKYYDRTPLTHHVYGVYPDQQYDLVSGHTLTLNVLGWQLGIGESTNHIAMEDTRITSPTRDVTHNYEINYDFGMLKVLPNAIIYVTSASDWKYYDGTALSNGSYDVNVAQGAIREDLGHSVSANVFGTITEVGEEPNALTVQILDAANEDVSDYYVVYPIEGTLEVREPPEPEFEEQNFVVGRIKTEKGGIVYLKQYNRGDYNGRGWDPAPPYWDTLPSGLSYQYLTSYALAGAGQVPGHAEFKDLAIYMLPYSMGFDGNYEYQTSDTVFQGTMQDFELSYYTIPSAENGYDSLKGYLGDYAAYEEQYREFVYKTYLTLDEESRLFMEGLIAEQGFDANDAGVIEAVASYIQNAAVYDAENYDRAMDEEPNVAIAFLQTYKRGKCVHYASAATLLYRALGIPARYVEGFMLTTVAGEFTDIKTPGHAWVEVYVDEIGWIPVEVTGGSSEDDPTEDESKDEEIKISKVPSIPAVQYVRIYSDISAAYYLRDGVGGDYTGSGFGAAPVYNGKIHPMLLAGFALQNSGYESHTISVEDVSNTRVGYYLVSGLNPGSDVPTMIDGNIYSYDIISTDYKAFLSGCAMPEEWIAEEKLYYEFVKATYLQIPEDTKAALLQIAAENGLSADSPNVISDVLRYVKNAVPYNIFHEPFPEDCDMAVYFLTEATGGVCAHFATAATMMYRALGIPARYVTGVVPQSKAGQWVDAKVIPHAWTEIYMPGYGWVKIDATGSGNFPPHLPTVPGDEPMDDMPMDKPTIEIVPKYQWKYYDGEALLARSQIDVDHVLAELLDQGYTYTVEVVGSQTEIGIGYSAIVKFVLYDPDGTDVTDMYDVVFKGGILEVFDPAITVIRVYLYQLQKRYDGTPLAYEPEDYEIIEIPDGVELALDLNISLTEVSSLSLADINADISKYAAFKVFKDGRDVSEAYVLRFEELFESGTYLPIRVDPRVITVQSASQTKVADGKPLENHQVTVSAGKLVEGHTMQALVTGRIDSVGTELNTIDMILITDENGNDVTECYKFYYDFGKLTILDPAS